jgi:hypothetical protein
MLVPALNAVLSAGEDILIFAKCGEYNEKIKTMNSSVRCRIGVALLALLCTKAAMASGSGDCNTNSEWICKPAGETRGSITTTIWADGTVMGCELTDSGLSSCHDVGPLRPCSVYYIRVNNETGEVVEEGTKNFYWNPVTDRGAFGDPCPYGS